MPWTGLNEISITFSEDVQFGIAALAVYGTRIADYALDPASYSYNSATRTATWRLAAGESFDSDRIMLHLEGDGPNGVRTAAGVYLDGDWINPVGVAAGGDAFPSGNGSPGGDFRFALNVLPGDTTGDGVVLARDFAEVKKKFFKNTTSPVTGTDADYSPFHDIDGSGAILANDFSEVKKRFFNALPAAPQPAAVAVFSNTGVMDAHTRGPARPPRRGVLVDASPDVLG